MDITVILGAATGATASSNEAVIQGILIGGIGGAIAGLSVWIVQFCHECVVDTIHKMRVDKWLSENTADEDEMAFRSTRAIASWNNLTEDRVRYICSIHPAIYLSTGPKPDLWTLYATRSRTPLKQSKSKGNTIDV